MFSDWLPGRPLPAALNASQRGPRIHFQLCRQLNARLLRQTCTPVGDQNSTAQKLQTVQTTNSINSLRVVDLGLLPLCGMKRCKHSAGNADDGSVSRSATQANVLVESKSDSARSLDDQNCRFDAQQYPLSRASLPIMISGSERKHFRSYFTDSPTSAHLIHHKAGQYHITMPQPSRIASWLPVAM